MSDRPDIRALFAGLPRTAIPAFVGGIVGDLVTELLRIGMQGRQEVAEERCLTIKEAAARLDVTEDWLRRRPDLPFVRKLSEGVVRYSARALDDYISNLTSERGAGPHLKVAKRGPR